MNNNMDLNCNEHLIQEHPPQKTLAYGIIMVFLKY